MSDSAPPGDDATADTGTVRAVVEWVRGVTGEVAALPETLRSFREGVAQFREVTGRLETATETIDRVNAHGESTGLFDALRRLDDTARALEREALNARDRLPGREILESATRDMQTVLGALSGFVTGPARAGFAAGRPPGAAGDPSTGDDPERRGDTRRADGDTGAD